MLITASEIIILSLQKIGVFRLGESPTDAELAVGLTGLKLIIEGLGGDRRMIPQSSLDSVIVNPDDSSPIVIFGGDGEIAPFYIDESSTMTVMDVEGHEITVILRMLTRKEFAQTSNINTGIIYEDNFNPTYLFYDYRPNGKSTVNIWPWPQKSVTLNLITWKPLIAPTFLTDNVECPPNYANLYIYKLALWLTSNYGAQVDPLIVQGYSEALKNIIEVNTQSQLGVLTPGEQLPPMAPGPPLTA